MSRISIFWSFSIIFSRFSSFGEEGGGVIFEEFGKDGKSEPDAGWMSGMFGRLSLNWPIR